MIGKRIIRFKRSGFGVVGNSAVQSPFALCIAATVVGFRLIWFEFDSFGKVRDCLIQVAFGFFRIAAIVVGFA